MTSAAQDTETLRDRVERINWLHRIDLGGGLVTPGADRSEEKLQALRLPSLRGKTVLDVGAWDGFFSFAAERLGAARVLATDSFVWRGGGGGSKEGFLLAREALHSKVEDQPIDVLELTPEAIGGRFDVVLFLGVLYHMRDPLLALERVAGVTGELLVVETLADMMLTRRPAAAFYPASEMNADATNWWGLNVPALVGMLRAVGFARVEVVGGRSRAGQVAHAARTLAWAARTRLGPREQRLPWSHAATDRVVLHAWR